MTDDDTCLLYDMPRRHGLVSRTLHWIMAYLLMWQFVVVIGWIVLGDGAFMRTVSLFGPAHATVGTLVCGLVLPRSLWAFLNRHRRPPADAPPLGWLARGVHGAFYALMLIVPALALVRAYGAGKGYDLWGLQLIPATGHKVAALIAPADLFHAPLAWTLAVLISGHVVMALYHGIIRGDGTLARMAGPLRT